MPDADILVVDDNSPDGTADLADEVGSRARAASKCCAGREKIGLGDAYRAGFAVGIDRGYDVARADRRRPLARSRRAPRAPRARSTTAPTPRSGRATCPAARSRTGRGTAARCRSGATATRRSCSACRSATRRPGYRAFRADILKTVDYASTRAKGYGFQIELAYRVWQHGGRIAEVPITFTDRVRGVSKMSWQVAAEELGLVTWWGSRTACSSGTAARAA